MKNWVFTLLMLSAILTGPALSAKALTFSFILYKNGTLEPLYVTPVEGGVSAFQNKDGPYIVALLDGQNRMLDQAGFQGAFYIYSDPIVEVNRTELAGQLRYYDSARALVVRKNGLEIYKQEIGNSTEYACDHNGLCERQEDAFSCPSDCRADRDKICTPLADKVCDKSCPPGLDPDCTVREPPWMVFGLVALLCAGAAVALLVLAIAAWIWIRKPLDAAKKKGNEGAKRKKMKK